VDRDGFLHEVEKGHDLKHAETVDKSGPAIDRMFRVHIVLTLPSKRKSKLEES
jgi:hypothetical protein